jgi:isocitrate/isopropylmalate dehydrogenase/regulator of RNase E activity RraA
MKPSKNFKIAVLPGDGIGAEVTHAALPVFNALNIPAQLVLGDIGWSCWKKEGTPIPERTWQLINSSHTVLLGATTSKPPREAQIELAQELQNKNFNYIPPVILLRQNLDLYANIRPCFSLKEDMKSFDFCIIRENTEGLYCGFDYHPLPKSIRPLITKKTRWQKISDQDISCALRLQSSLGLSRVFQAAFHYADKHQMKRVTFADKPNVLRLSGEFAREIFEATASQYPHIHADILNVDAVALWLIRRPEQFGVIVAENMFGDILSDVGAGVMGGLGFAPSANIGEKNSYFEPVHGSAPQIGPNKANPSAMFLTISMLLTHFGYKKQAQQIRQSLSKVLNKGRFLTYDLGGNASTTDMANAIIEECLCSKIKNRRDTMETQLQKLHTYSTPQISDALDALGIEGALLDIKPLMQGMKLIGPAYTVEYTSNKKNSKQFKNAANYIDSIPKDSVIVIANKGRIDCTVWGAILTQMAIQRGIAGTVVHGAIRDIDFIQAAKYPLFCTGIYMRSGKNRVHKLSEQKPLLINGVTIHPGDIIFADNHGTLVIPRHLINSILNKAKQIKLTEQKIASAIQEGCTLEQARIDYRYDQPWLGVKK